MGAVGIICEYNPFHKGHVYHIERVKELYPDKTIILVLNGYFLERGEVSILTKENKTKLALLYGVDLVVELPFIFGTQSADIFADAAITILHYLGCDTIVFGSESNDVELLKKIVDIEETSEYNEQVKQYLDEGVNYPTAMSKALGLDVNIFKPNDLLGISYIKAIKKHDYSITPITIKRTSNYHDLDANDEIISASNIRSKIKRGEDITYFVPKKVIPAIDPISLSNFFPYIKYKILTDQDLSRYLTVDEGIEFRLKEKLENSTNLEEFIENIKTKRYTYNKISRMLIHILVGVPKEINKLASIEYIKILGFNSMGRNYLHHLEEAPVAFVPIPNTLQYRYEMLATEIYQLVSPRNILNFEKSNKPIYFE